ncbi:MAG: Asp-tRNA(Asn)/Glu-tRNA(Gln) amidotransferase subunit GatB [Candidatus Omnitrophica bacterium]|nr:Asp-tRNA(Asn)/Glu-tRNA(Gln) amidotransferase subunit GatB [Candidatus Omnitrophota bacterium]
MEKFETVIGLEVHLQLKTATKIFCSCTNHFGAKPNSNTCPVCLGLPGSLPVFNEQALEYAIRVGLALNCTINPFIKFDRKNYFYPDLPKGYQISQFDKPICSHGHLLVHTSGKEKRIGITRAHLEEDAGKLIHDQSVNASLVDYNRTGTPLIEIVSEPDMRSAQEAYDYLSKLKLTLQYLNVSDCDMEKGSLRCDANVSIRPVGYEKFGTKTELKNMNSFKAVKSAIEYEVNRHTQIILSGGKITQETLLWNEEKAITVAMRGKEQAHDYRYFPDPDLVSFTVEEQLIAQVRSQMPELPAQKAQRFVHDYKLSEYDASVLIQDKKTADFFESCVAAKADPKKASNWITSVLAKELTDRKIEIDEMKMNAASLVELIKNVEEGVISNLAGKDVLKVMMDSGKGEAQIIAEQGLAQVSDDGALEKMLDEIFVSHADVVQQVKQGKQSAVGFLVGQAMKKSQGKANPKKLGEMITRRITNV